MRTPFYCAVLDFYTTYSFDSPHMVDSAMPTVFVRRARPEDEQRIRSFVHQLSSTSRRNRFHGTVSADSPKLVDELLGDNGVSHGAWVACIWGTNGEEIVGEGGWHLIDVKQRQAEMGLSVLDAWQGSGVAQLLMAKLMAGASDAGVCSIYGDVLDSNERMRSFMERHGMQPSSDWPWDSGGTVRMERQIP